MSGDWIRDVDARRRLIDASLSGGDPEDADTEERVAYYDARVDEGIRAMVRPGGDPRERGLAEDTAYEAMYRAMVLRRHGGLPARRSPGWTRGDV